MDSRDILGGAGPGEGDEFCVPKLGYMWSPLGNVSQSEEPLWNCLED